MESDELSEIRKLFDPLIEEHGEILKSIIVYGSAARQERVEGSDIDILIILDDNAESFSKEKTEKINSQIKEIQRKSEERDIDLHIQPPKTLSKWYSLLLKGKPWAVTSLRHSQSIYDPENFQSSMKEIIVNSQPQSTRKRSQNLRQDFKKNIVESRELIRKSFKQILNNVDSSLQEMLEYKTEKRIPDEKIPEKTEELSEELETEKYRSLRAIENQVSSGERQPDIEKLEKFSTDALDIIEDVHNALEDDLAEFKEETLEETLNELENSCKILLEDLNIEYEEENILDAFRENVIEEGMLSEDYWRMIEKTRSMKEEEPDELEEEAFYQPITGLKEFEAAVNSILEKDLFESYELPSDSKEAHLTPINEFEKEVLNEYPEVKGVYVISSEKLFETDSAAMVLVIDEIEDLDEEQLKNFLGEKEREIGEEHGFNIHSRTETLEEYWKRLQDGDEELIYEIVSGLISHDSNGILESTKKLAENGELPETIPYLRTEIEKASIQTVAPIEKIKQECLKNFYEASVKIGQAELLEEGTTPPVQKKVPEVLRKEMEEDRNLSEEDIAIIEKAIETFKEVEHGENREIKTEELDKIYSGLQRIEEKIKTRQEDP